MKRITTPCVITFVSTSQEYSLEKDFILATNARAGGLAVQATIIALHLVMPVETSTSIPICII